ncbi:DUF1161 domain-containing protein [Undibacterium sp. RuRC25W]|uniref:DUF1161 domain-containing protein n=1 Tax=Undibacterium sp. RuRC25W TaxID=3413047 RepID=UPI003BF0A1DE
MYKRVLITNMGLSLMLSATSGWAAVTSCDNIMNKINTKLEHKEVTDYSLNVVSKDTKSSLRVVGVCEGGSKKVIYKKIHHAGKKADQDEQSANSDKSKSAE